MIALLLALQAFPQTGPVNMRVEGGMWNNQLEWYDTVMTRWCCVEVFVDSIRENPSPLVQREDTVQRHRSRITVRDYAYYGYPSHYDTSNPLAAPGDTILIYLSGPRVIQGPAYFPLDSAVTWVADAMTGDTLSQGVYIPLGGDTILVMDTLFAIRPQPGDSLIAEGNVRLYAGGLDSLIAPDSITIYSDSLVFPVLTDSVVIDTLGMAHAFDAPGPALAFGFSEGWNRGRSGRYSLSLGRVGPSASGAGDLSVGLDMGMAGGMANRRDTRHDQRGVASSELGNGYALRVAARGGRVVNDSGVRPNVSQRGATSPGDVFGYAGDSNGRIGVSADNAGRGDRHDWAGGGGYGAE